MRVMVIGAHADDESLGAGGTIVRHVAASNEVRVVICADCRTVRHGYVAAPALLPHALDAGKVLGIQEIRFLGWRGMTLSDGPELRLTQEIEAEIRDFKPEIVYTHHAGDLNSDHRSVSRAVMTATRPGPLMPAKVLHFEVPSSTGWETPSTFAPNYFVALDGATLDKKLAAMACYRDELRPAPHPRSLEALRQRAAYWGQMCGVEYAEPYMLMREVRSC